MMAFTFRPFWRDPRSTVILWVAITLVTVFAALAPLYVRMVAIAELDIRLATLSQREQRLELSAERPISDEAFGLIQSALGDTLRDTYRYAYAPIRLCGLGTQDGQLSVYLACIRQYSYPDLGSRFDVIEGRLPQPNPDTIEFVLTRAVIEKSAALNPDYRISVGNLYKVSDENDFPYTLELVGIVDPNVPESAAQWNGQEGIFGAVILSTSAAPDELEMGLLVHPDVFPAELAPNALRLYIARASLELTQIRAGELDALGRRLDAALADVRRVDPTITALSPISTLIANFQARLTEVGQPVLLLVALTLILLLYTLITTGALILNRARTAWAQMAGRGASARQLILMHALVMLSLSLAAWLLSVPLALVFATALASFGPQAEVLENPSLSELPPEMLVFGGAAALLAFLALVLPAVPAAFTSFARLKSESGRPAERPLWARYYADLILTGLGLAFVVRARTEFANLTDPFSVAGPALLLVGAALLWLRVFPLLMRGIGALLSALNRFSVRLAFWGLERDPAQSSQLVMLVVGALALGTASLALSFTRDNSAWDTAQGSLAADAVLTLDPALASLDAYAQLPGVTASESQIMLIEDETPTRLHTVLIGYSNFDAPELAALAELDYGLPGIAVPPDTARLSIEVYAEEGDLPTTTEVTLEISNRDQLRVLLPLDAADKTTVGEWTLYSAALDAQILGQAPYRITGVQFPSVRQESSAAFTHAVYLADLRAVSIDGTATPLIDLTADPAATFTRPVENADARTRVLNFEPSLEILTPEGEPSLRVFYNRGPIIFGASPSLYVMESDEPIPVLVTQAFADTIGSGNALRRPLVVGDSLRSDFSVPLGRFRSLRMNYLVVGIVPPPAPYPPDQQILLTRADWLQAQVNRRHSTLSTGIGVNHVHLTLAEREPSPELRAVTAALPGLTTADFAWDRFAALQRAPLANAVTGMLFAGFFAAFGLITLQAGFYTAVTLRRRAGSFAVLRSLGWGNGHLVRMLAVEQAAVVLPALIMGVLVGAGLAVLLMPLLGITAAGLQLPAAQIIALMGVVGALFVVLLGWSARMLRGVDVAQQVRAVD